MPRRGSRTGKASKSSKTARVLGLLTNPANMEDSGADAQLDDREDDKAAQAEIRSALEQELLGLLPNGDLAPSGGAGVNPFAPPSAFQDTEPPQEEEPSVSAGVDAAPHRRDSDSSALSEPAREETTPSAEASPAPHFSAPPEAAPAPGFSAPPEAAPVPDFSAPVEAAPAPDFSAPVEAAPAPDFSAPMEAAPVPDTPAANPSVSASVHGDKPVVQDWNPPHVDVSKESRENLVLGHPEEWICFNLTQALVEEKTEKYMKLFGMCTCARCKVDVTAIALMNLPVKYVATQNRDVVPLLSMYETKYSAEVVSQVIGACKKVMTRPHHGRN